jgi:uncharacterized membrane protein YdjX (TVP38/TMEM64 family)
VLCHHGFLAVLFLRLVPIAPFAVEGVVAGAVRLKLTDFVLGTAAGMLPGMLTATVFGAQIESALTGGGDINWWLVGTVLGIFVIGTWAVRRWFRKMERKLSGHGAAAVEPR